MRKAEHEVLMKDLRIYIEYCIRKGVMPIITVNDWKRIVKLLKKEERK